MSILTSHHIETPLSSCLNLTLGYYFSPATCFTGGEIIPVGWIIPFPDHYIFHWDRSVTISSDIEDAFVTISDIHTRGFFLQLSRKIELRMLYQLSLWNKCGTGGQIGSSPLWGPKWAQSITRVQMGPVHNEGPNGPSPCMSDSIRGFLEVWSSRDTGIKWRKRYLFVAAFEHGNSWF